MFPSQAYSQFGLPHCHHPQTSSRQRSKSPGEHTGHSSHLMCNNNVSACLRISAHSSTFWVRRLGSPRKQSQAAFPRGELWSESSELAIYLHLRVTVQCLLCYAERGRKQLACLSCCSPNLHHLKEKTKNRRGTYSASLQGRYPAPRGLN